MTTPLPQFTRYHRALVALRLLAPAIACITAVLALLVLIGWQGNIETLKRLRPHWVAMNPATAVAILMASIALAASSATHSPRLTRLARILACLVALVGVIKLVAWLGGPDLHIDEALFASRLPDTTHRSGSHILPNSMAPNTAFLFLLTGLALFFLHLRKNWASLLSLLLPLLAILTAMLAVIGYLNGVASLYQAASAIPMALHTVLAFLFLSLGIIFLHLQHLDSPTVSLDLDKKINLGFGAALFLLALVGVASYASIQSFIAASDITQHTRIVIASFAELSATVASAESAERGYVITGQDAFLGPYQGSVDQIHARLPQLRSLVEDSQHQSDNLDLLVLLLEERIALLDKVIDVRRNQSLQAAVDIVANRQGQTVMGKINALLQDMIHDENSLDSLRSQQTAYSGKMTIAVISVGGLLAFTLVGLAGGFIRKDLALRKRIEADLHNARAAADLANQTKSSFLANMSHEIRTPMAAIIGFADLLLDPTQTQSDRLEYINTIRRNGDHLLTLINDILDLSKIEAGKFSVDRVLCCPCHVLSDVASLMRVRAAEKRIRFEVKNEGPIPSAILCDPARLRQILINLVGNAIKFTDEGWVKLIMKLETANGSPQRLRFDIIDTGIGMDSGQIAELFQPFVQVDGSMTRRFGGTGLGLTISKRLAELLGGNIAVDSSPGRGSTFSLLIDPGSLDGVVLLKDCREALAGVDLNTSQSQPRKLDGRVLLVDDGHDNRRLLSVYLRQAGAQVTLAENGRIGCDKALAALSINTPYDVILMDMQMPELDGYGAAARLRAKGYTSPIIALTAHAMADDRAKCLAAGCSDYLSKPVRREHLLALVERYIQIVRLNAPAAAAPPDPFLPQPGMTAGPIQSDLDDESLRPFLLAYIAELPSIVAELENYLEHRNLQELSERLHNLKGTGGLYGLMPISTAAGNAEALLQNKAAFEAVEAQVKNLIAILQRIEGYNNS